MDDFKRKLMLRESSSRLHSAETLRNAGDKSDSAYLLELLGFELLLKIVFELRTGQTPPKHHRYAEIFGGLPTPTQDELLRLTGERIGPSALSTDPNSVLTEIGNNFIHLRYPYDKYAGKTQDEYQQMGIDWIERGAKNEEAVFRYFPEELFGLTASMKKIADY